MLSVSNMLFMLDVVILTVVMLTVLAPNLYYIGKGLDWKKEQKLKILSISSLETGVARKKPLQAKLRADYLSLSLFLYLQCPIRKTYVYL
jgi:hypothetical protein